jgi:iron(III) transport system substrate-binding protein
MAGAVLKEGVMKELTSVTKAAITLFIFSSLIQLGHGLDISAAEKAGWRAEWEKTVEAAKREGRVNVYLDYSATALIDAGVFQRTFPEIKVFSVPMRDSQMRIITERRAGRYIPDVNIAGITQNYPDLYKARALDPIRPAFILPEVVDESRWWEGQHRYADTEKQYVFIFLGFPQEGSFRYNTRLVNPKEFRSLWDFVNPKWKGKIEARDARAHGPGGGALRFFSSHPELGPEFLRRLYGTMDVTLFRDFRQALDWLATGKFAICFACGSTEQAKAQGLPVDAFGVMKEGAGLVAQYGTISLMNNSPHPNAARVFINWFLSREGQLTLQRALAKAPDSSAPDSFRIDIPKDDVPPENRRLEGVKYLEMFTPERMDMRPIIKVFEEAMAEAGKR